MLSLFVDHTTSLLTKEVKAQAESDTIQPPSGGFPYSDCHTCSTGQTFYISPDYKHFLRYRGMKHNDIGIVHRYEKEGVVQNDVAFMYYNPLKRHSGSWIPLNPLIFSYCQTCGDELCSEDLLWYEEDQELLCFNCYKDKTSMTEEDEDEEDEDDD